MTEQQKAALEKILSSIDAARETFRSAVGQRHYVAGLYPVGIESAPGQDFYSRVLLMETQLMELAAEVANKLHS